MERLDRLQFQVSMSLFTIIKKLPKKISNYIGSSRRTRHSRQNLSICVSNRNMKIRLQEYFKGTSFRMGGSFVMINIPHGLTIE